MNHGCYLTMNGDYGGKLPNTKLILALFVLTLQNHIDRF